MNQADRDRVAEKIDQWGAGRLPALPGSAAPPTTDELLIALTAELRETNKLLRCFATGNYTLKTEAA